MKKKGKAGKKSKSVLKGKDSVSSEDDHISVSSSLPPSVEGQIRCFLSVSVSKFTWAVDKHPDDVSIRIRWWGDQGQGVLLRPVVKGAAKLNLKTKWTSVRYPVCSGPKQFAAYLNDMGSLVVEAVHTATQIPFGKALVSEITQLTATQPVNVIVPVMSVISPFGKMADVQVFIKFESVSVAYNKLSSTIPTVDTGLDRDVADRSNPHPTPPPYLNPATPVTHPRHQRHMKDPFESPAPVKEVKFSEDPPERLHYTLEPSLLSLLEHGESSGSTNQDVNQVQLTTGNEEDLSNRDADRMMTIHEDGQYLQNNNMDWIGALLEKGQRLREGLAMSTLLDDTDVAEKHSLQETHVLPGSLFQEILSSKKTGIHHTTHPHVISSDGQVVDGDSTLVDLLMGDHHSGIDLIEHSAYLSDLSEDVSEGGDPLHDDSLLMDLFYKQQEEKSADSDTTVSTDEEEQELQSSPTNKVDNDEETRVRDTQRQMERPVENEFCVHNGGLGMTLNSQQRTGVVPPDEHELGDRTLQPSQQRTDMVQKLGTDTLTTLGRVNTARLIIERLVLTDTSTLEQQKARKKPSTFFVEYDFPVAAKDITGKVPLVKELTRVASKKLDSKAVIFNHRSVFPVSFNATVLDHWWRMELAFRILKRESGQRMPEEFGVGSLPLKMVFLSNSLSLASVVEVNENKVKSGYITGKLEVKVELGLDGKQLYCQAPVASSTDSRQVPQESHSRLPLTSTTDKQAVLISKPPLPKQPQHQVREPIEPEDPADMLTLHFLLWIPEGKGVIPEPPGSSGRTANMFLVSRMFWCDEVCKSSVHWGTNHPCFAYKQVAPVLLTPILLQRMCNNFIVIEVWNKAVPQGDKLVGISKIPLHQFYLSFRDPKITKTLLKSKFPVICIDGLVPVVNLFTTHSHGQLQVLLAMGTQEQIASLLEIKGSSQTSSGLHNKDMHHLDKPRDAPQSNVKHNITGNTSLIDHQFEITVEDIRGLSVFRSTVWGETDCYVQYHFPSQIQSTEDLDQEVVPGLRTFHTCTTLCVPDPSFQDTTRHSFTLPSGVPVQRYLLAAYSGSWTSVSSIPGSGGMSFELWRRYYYPNVRDQLVAKANLPVAKLCAMVTMKRHREPSVQTFSLPLAVLPEEDRGSRQTMIDDSGLLDVTIKYRANKIHGTDNTPALDHVCLSVDVIRICGLKDAAKSVCDTSLSMSYPADVGVNAYVVIKLPIGKRKQLITRTVARTFAPEYSHHIEISTPLQMQRKSSGHDQGEIISLAEVLEMSAAVLEVWHQDSRGFGDMEQQHKSNKHDVLLGVVTVPLADLLTHRTGIRGWHAIRPEDALLDENQHDNVLGGLQLSIKFDDPKDRESVMHVGRSLGWSPPPGVDDAGDEGGMLLCSEGNDDDDDGQTPRGLALSVKITRAWLLTDQLNLERKGYIRYKLYDKSPVCSSVVRIKQNKDDLLILDVKHSKCFLLPVTSSLEWYFKEEPLEVQVWLRGQAQHSKAAATLPGQRDKLLGSAFIKLTPLVSKRLHHSQTSFSGTFPLFKAGTDAINGACVHVHVSLAKPTAKSHTYKEEMDGQEAIEDSSSVDYPSTKGQDDNESESLQSNTDPHTAGKNPETQPHDEDAFAAHVIIQEARHVELVSQRITPNAYVTYQTSPSSLEVSTPVCEASSCPVWEYQKLERLPLSMLNTQSLIFKVWHKTNDDSKSQIERHIGGGDVPLGFASVDLGPLAAGLRQLIGWYNIMDFNGKCKGQIKLGVVPLTPVSPSRCPPKSRIVMRSSVSEISKARLFVQDQQVQVPGVPSLSDQKQDYLDKLQSLDSLSTQTLPDGNTEPVMTSTSVLFRQLRENMKDLDHLQTRLRAKLYTDSPMHRPSDILYPAEEETPCAKSLDQYTQDIAGDNMADSDKEDQDMNHVLVVSDNVSNQSVKNSFGVLDRNHDKEEDNKSTTSGDSTLENTSQNRQTLTNEEHVSHVLAHSPMKDASDAMPYAVVGGSQKYSSSSPGNDENGTISTIKETNEKSFSSASECSSASELEHSLEDGSHSPSVPPFMEERDSWLSSGEEEDEAKKSPLGSNTFSLINHQDGCVREESSKTKEQVTHLHSIAGNTESTVANIESSIPCSHRDTFGEESNELLQHDCADDQTSVYSTGENISTAHTLNYKSCFPNFFMPRDQLEHSMRALRLNSKLSHSGAPLDMKQGQSRLLQRTCKVSTNAGSQYSQKQISYKAKKDGQPPLSSAEIERIARIFTSKDS